METILCLLTFHLVYHILSPQHCGIEKAFLFDVVSKIYIATDSSLVDMQAYELCCDMIDVVIDVSCIYSLKDGLEGSAYDTQSASTIHLNNGTVLYLREVNKYLALVCLLREECFEKQGKFSKSTHPHLQLIDPLDGYSYLFNSKTETDWKP